MNSFISKKVLFILFITTQLIYSQSSLKTWTQTTAEDFSKNQLSNLVVQNDSGGEVSLIHPLKKTIDDYLDNTLNRHIVQDSTGNYIKAWNSENGNIYLQKFSADNKKLTSAIKVNEGSGNIHMGITGASTAVLNSGACIVIWRNSVDGFLYGQMFTNDSVKVGKNFKIDDGVVSWGDASVIANNAEQIFQIFYTVRKVYPDDKLFIQTRDIHGNKIGDTKQLNKESLTTFEYNPNVLLDKDNYWVLWNGYSIDEQMNESNLGLYLRHFKNDGTPLTAAIFLSPYSQANSSLCVLKDSHLLVAWDQQNETNGGFDIWGQLFNTEGVTIGRAFQINSINSNNQDPDIVIKNNEFQISWWCNNQTYVTRFKFDPQLNGEMISSVFEGSPKGSLYKEIAWDFNANPMSALKFQLRSGNNTAELENAEWFGPTSKIDYYSTNTGQSINSIHNGKRYIQYKAFFDSDYGNSSELKSVSIRYTPNDTIAPKTPKNLTVTENHVNVFLKWEASNSNDLAHYKIYRGSESKKYDSKWFRQISKDNLSYTDSSAQVGKKYYYTITAIDSSHNESDFSNEAIIIFKGINIYVSSAGSSNGDGSKNNPVNSIQKGMDLAMPGDTLQVLPGEYGDLFMHKNRVSLIGAGAKLCTVNTKISFANDCLIKGFTFTKSLSCEKTSPIITENIIRVSDTYAITVSDSNSPVISKNFISGSKIGIGVGFGPYGDVRNPEIRNNIIIADEIGLQFMYMGNSKVFNNTVFGGSASIVMVSGSDSKIENNILIGFLNGRPELSSGVQFNNVWSEGPKTNMQIPATNIFFEPIFVNADTRDYHLQQTSQCINAGNSDPIYNDTDGSRNDIGAYGGSDPFNLDIISQLTRSINVPSISAYPGDTIKVDVNMDKVKGLGKATFALEYDNNILSYIKCEPGEATKTFSITDQPTTNRIKVVLSSSTPVTNESKNLLRILLAVNKTAKTNDASQLVLSDVKMQDSLSREIFIRSISNGAFVVNNTTESSHYLYVDEKNTGREDGNKKHPFRTISSAINKAVNGDTIWVAGGDYRESINMKEGINLIGVGTSVTNIIVTTGHYAVLFDGVTKGKITGFSFKAENSEPNISGYIICNASSPVISGNRFENQKFESNAILCERKSTPLIEGNYFDSTDVVITDSKPIIKNNYIKAYQTGITCNQNSYVKITGNRFTGFGIPTMISVRNSSAEIQNNVMLCRSFCTGITLFNADNVKVLNNIIKATGSNVTGLFIYESQNTEIVNNTISTSLNGISEESSSSNVLNNIIVNNSGFGAKLSNSSQLDYNDFWNNSVNYQVVNAGSNNIQKTVLFADTLKNNYYLMAGSPCINAGHPDAKYNDIDGSRNDIGAYGGPYSNATSMNNSGSILAANQSTDNDTIIVKIKGEKIKSIAKLSLSIEYDPDILSLINTKSSDLTKSFSLEKIVPKQGALKIIMDGNKGLDTDAGVLVDLYFTSKAKEKVNTTLNLKSAEIFDEIGSEKIIAELKDGELVITTDIAQNKNELPKSFSLSQNYPNPFNPITIIKYEIPKSSKVSLLIYDILGRVVDILVNEEMIAGTYSVKWNASKFASGVYFYTIRAGNYTTTKKMMLVK